MFYSQCLLSGKGPLGAIWVAAYFFKKLKKAQVTETDIPSSVGWTSFLFTFPIYSQVCPLSFMLGLPFGVRKESDFSNIQFFYSFCFMLFCYSFHFVQRFYILLVVFELECGCGEETTGSSSSSLDFGFVGVLTSNMWKLLVNSLFSFLAHGYIKKVAELTNTPILWRDYKLYCIFYVLVFLRISTIL